MVRFLMRFIGNNLILEDKVSFFKVLSFFKIISFFIYPFSVIASFVIHFVYKVPQENVFFTTFLVLMMSFIVLVTNIAFKLLNNMEVSPIGGSEYAKEENFQITFKDFLKTYCYTHESKYILLNLSIAIGLSFLASFILSLFSLSISKFICFEIITGIVAGFKIILHFALR